MREQIKNWLLKYIPVHAYVRHQMTRGEEMYFRVFWLKDEFYSVGLRYRNKKGKIETESFYVIRDNIRIFYVFHIFPIKNF